jgi:hypothetical protein
MDRQIDPQGRLFQLSGIDVDHDLERVPGKTGPVVADLADVQAAGQDQQEIGVLDREVAGPFTDGAGPAA